jgi:uncharacterized membrane protein
MKVALFKLVRLSSYNPKTRLTTKERNVSKSRDFVIDSARSSCSNRSVNMLFVISRSECRDSIYDSDLLHKWTVVLTD